MSITDEDPTIEGNPDGDVGQEHVLHPDRLECATCGQDWPCATEMLRMQTEAAEDEPEPMLEINPLLLDRNGNQPRFWTEPDWFEVTTTIGSNGREIEVLPKPNFSVDEVAKVFFGKGPDWLRWRHGRGDFVLDGRIYEPPRTAAGHRYYTLADIERLATALTDQGAMDAMQLQRISIHVKLIAQTYGLLDD